jgi:hypothetical protein
MSNAEQIDATVPVTITIDLQQLLTANVGEIPPYTGDPDDEWEPPTPMVGAIVGATANQLAVELKRDATGYHGMQSRIRDQIDEKIAEVVAGQLDREFKPVDSYGEVQRNAEPTTLREQIKKQAETVLAKGMAPRDQYSNNPVQGVLRKYIDDEIARLIKAELAKAVEQAKAEVLAKVKGSAAQVITDTITQISRQGVR